MTPTTLNLLSDSITRSVGYGRMVRSRTMPTFAPRSAHVTNRVTRRHRVTALQEEHDVGAVGHEFLDPRVVATAEDAAQTGRARLR